MLRIDSGAVEGVQIRTGPTDLDVVIEITSAAGFRRFWTGTGYRREARDLPLPVGVDVDGPAYRLDCVFVGYDAFIDARATRSRKARIS